MNSITPHSISTKTVSCVLSQSAGDERDTAIDTKIYQIPTTTVQHSDLDSRFTSLLGVATDTTIVREIVSYRMSEKTEQRIEIVPIIEITKQSMEQTSVANGV